VTFSPDGLHWSVPEWIATLDDPESNRGTGAGDVLSAFFDPKRGEFVALFKMMSLPGEYTIPVKRGVPGPGCQRRIMGMSRSKDFRAWSKARTIVRPDSNDPPTLEFYGISNIVLRGGLFVGFIRCLIDDVPPDGIGWTELILSRDADHWHRVRQPFLQRSTEDDSAPDHAIAWISEIATVGDRDFIYYAGTAYGHKIGARAGCLAFLRKDGFVSVDAGVKGGRLVTKPLRVPQGTVGLTLNAEGGEIRVQLSKAGKPLDGYSYDDCEPVRADSVSAPVRWRGRSVLPATTDPVQIGFLIRSARLYGFEFDIE
jgi:hypothetical protein